MGGWEGASEGWMHWQAEGGRGAGKGRSDVSERVGDSLDLNHETRKGGSGTERLSASNRGLGRGPTLRHPAMALSSRRKQTRAVGCVKFIHTRRLQPAVKPTARTLSWPAHCLEQR